MFSQKQTKELEAPLDAAVVKCRNQGGRQVSYIEGWHAIAEANRIFGFGNWSRATVDIHQVGETTKNDNNNFVVGYMARVRVTVSNADGQGEVVRDGCGFGSGFAKQEADAHESAIKEAETDAMKRALMTFGNPFGLALYDKSKANVERNGARSSTGGASVSKTEGEGSSPSAPANGTPFFERESFAISSNANFDEWSDDHWDKWHGQFQAAIDKCPKDISKFTKLQEDNTNHLNAYQGVNEEACAALMQNFAKRSAEAAQGPAS